MNKQHKPDHFHSTVLLMFPLDHFGTACKFKHWERAKTYAMDGSCSALMVEL
jgi:hypothetical protein